MYIIIFFKNGKFIDNFPNCTLEISILNKLKKYHMTFMNKDQNQLLDSSYKYRS